MVLTVVVDWFDCGFRFGSAVVLDAVLDLICLWFWDSFDCGFGLGSSVVLTAVLVLV